ncbi:hypothetical protein B0H17DRAFT_1333397 [Mycena rosella]|uniref:Uncharacterized protein n=1 Tax=Mycena rosella TaxID=1033263 RepID=A0AAD7D7C6_MYCRO|nr:hypothetical protein B0H17DRAFT_1333397 [Mycena rosella]
MLEMWSDLSISIPSHSRPWINYPIALLEEQISRAGQHALSVTLISDEHPGYITVKIFAAIPLPTGALLRMHHNIPRLREIHISFNSEEGYVGHDIFESVPVLHVVRITEPCPDLRLEWRTKGSPPPIPYRRRGEKVSFVCPPAWILANTPSPLTSALWASHRISSCANPGIIELSIIDGGNIESIIRSLSADAPDVLVPSLRTFNIDTQVGLDIWHVVFDMTVGRIGVTLERLCIRTSYVAPHELRPFWACLRGLEQMGLQVQFTDVSRPSSRDLTELWSACDTGASTV